LNAYCAIAVGAKGSAERTEPGLVHSGRPANGCCTRVVDSGCLCEGIVTSLIGCKGGCSRRRADAWWRDGETDVDLLGGGEAVYVLESNNY